MKQFLHRRWFLLALCGALVVGIAGAESLDGLSDVGGLRRAIVAIVLFLMALPLPVQSVWRTLQRPVAPLLATLVNFGLLPLAAWALTWAVTPMILSQDTATGLLVAAATPCTLASASVWTRRAGGNDAVAIVVTLVTNASCFLVTPLWLTLMTGQETRLDPWAMASRLGQVVVVPMLIAQLLRLNRGIADWATRRQTPLAVLAQCGILSMIFLGAVQTGLRLREVEGHEMLQSLAGLLVAVLLIHTGMLWVGLRLARLLRQSHEDAVAVGFAGSQKTLMVGLQVSMDLGVSVLPMVAYHVCQLLVDTVVADRLRQRGPPAEKSADP